MTDTDCVIVGAGVAGLGAAAALRQAGRTAVVVEASPRVGGRAWTAYPEALGHVWFDMGAVWFHDAENNPLTAIARTAGDTLLRSDEIRKERTFIGSRQATDAELQDYQSAWSRYEAATDALLARHGDVPLAEIARALPGDPWSRTIEAWEGPVICAVDAQDFSARDWRNNALNGVNLVPEGGIGSFVRRRLTQGLDIRLDMPVRRVRWGGPNGSVSIETDAGALTAATCIITVSTGVLGSGALRFDPALPARVTEAIDALPMGLANKIVLRATGPDRLDLPLHCSVDVMVNEAHPVLMPFQCWPFGRDYVQAWIGGSTAWDLARDGDAASIDYALSYLRSLFGGRVDGLFRHGPTVLTHWHADPWVRGAYCYARPGASGAREALGEPVSDGHLMFAGEACNTPYAGTVAGAWISGQKAAKTVLATLGG
ncbi:MAG TPA: NAD(P)/FAD-dependent oxidoreductase [Rhodopila sp.]|uniref:flavin monoamine oxidase family protein n=1 Tax=Rhodopila sp. TaxID=2480087 RepID=UPI002C883703|nr:NAD(P)/FAD-dependent oxidoreductase [Rhodopila sp.]HVY15314.1 NAD(P)/FAD-dependent oxidoreductase [Rhodopila sp.]